MQPKELVSPITAYCIHSDGSGTKNRIFGYPESTKKWGLNMFKGKVEQGISSLFWSYFWHIWWFLKVCRHDPLWKILIYAKNIGKKWRKTLLNLPFNPFHLLPQPETQISTQVSGSTQSVTNTYCYLQFSATKLKIC